MGSGRHALPSRWGKLYREIAKFGMVGASGFIVNLAVFNLVRTVTDWQTVRASVLATVVAILSNYLGLRYFAYRNREQEDRNSRRKELTLFLIFSAIGLVIENSVLYVTTYGLGWDGTLATNVSKFLGIGVATLFRFWSYRTWVFRTAGNREPAGSRESADSLQEPVLPYPEPVLSGSWERT